MSRRNRIKVEASSRTSVPRPKTGGKASLCGGHALRARRGDGWVKGLGGGGNPPPTPILTYASNRGEPHGSLRSCS